VGGSTTGTTMSMLPQVEGSKTPFFSMGAASVIVEPVRPYTFKLPHSDRLAAQKVLQDMKKRGITKFALLSDTGGFGKGGHTETLKAAQAMGMIISVDQNYGEKDTDITPQLTKVKSSDAQAIFVFGTGQAPAIVAKNYQQLGLKVPLYMSHGQASMEFVKLSGDAAEGIRMPSPALLVAEQLADGDPQKKIGVDYKNTYEKQYKTDVSTFGGYAYDGLMMSIAALKQVGSTDKKKVRDAIEGMKNFPGVNGVYNMSATDHNGLDDKSFVMTEIRKGQFKKID
jgi:branched-chain amino acid transport system substrate-binding protein